MNICVIWRVNCGWLYGIHRITINERCYMLGLWVRFVTVRSHMQNLTHPRAPTTSSLLMPILNSDISPQNATH